MSQKNNVVTSWRGGVLMKSTNPSGHNLVISGENEVEEKSYRPKALMLSSLAGCSGADVISLIKKMRIDVDAFEIDIEAELTEEHPKYYKKVLMVFNFYGSKLDKKKLQKAVDLSVEKYCGVMAMFRQFSEVTIEIEYHDN